MFSVLCGRLRRWRLHRHSGARHAAIRRHAIGNFDDHDYAYGDVFFGAAAPIAAYPADADSEIAPSKQALAALWIGTNLAAADTEAFARWRDYFATEIR